MSVFSPCLTCCNKFLPNETSLLTKLRYQLMRGGNYGGDRFLEPSNGGAIQFGTRSNTTNKLRAARASLAQPLDEC